MDITETIDTVPVTRPGFVSWIRRCTAFIEICLTRQNERRCLGELTDEQLKDIGLSRADVDRECRRWPWDGAGRDFRPNRDMASRSFCSTVAGC